MKIKHLGYLILSATIIAFAGCKKDDDDPAPSGGGGNTETGPGTVYVNISNTSGNVNVDETGATSYTNTLGENYNVTMLKYYLSNFELFNDDTAIAVNDTYFLVDEADAATTELPLPNIPEGYYKGLRFMIGVDVNKYNDLTGQAPGSITGPLDPANNMMWQWSTGYIHFKMEGSYGPSLDSLYFYHIGGMSGQYSGQRMVELYFAGDSLHVAGTHEAELHLKADVQKLFDGEYSMPLGTVHNIMTANSNSIKIADNYATMFEFEHMHN